MAQQQVDFGQMMGGDPEALDLQRKRALVEALIKSQQGRQPANYKRHPLAIVADFMSQKGARDQIKSISEQEKAMLMKRRESEQGELKALLDGMVPQQVPFRGPMPDGSEPPVQQVPADPRAAIMKAMVSQSPIVRGMAGNLYKERGDSWREVVKAIPGHLEPKSILESAGTHSVEGLRASPSSPMPEISNIGDVQMIKKPDGKGGFTWEQVRKPISVTATSTLNAEAKPALETDEQEGKYWAAGGKGWDKGQLIKERLASTQDALRTLIENPRMGAGAEAFQFLDKWASTLGVRTDDLNRVNTDVMKAQLGERIIKELGGLGNQVSNADVEFMKSAMGALGTDPTAMRRLLLISAKYQMQGLNRLNQHARAAEQIPAFQSRGRKFPGYDFSLDLPPELADELETLWQGKIKPIPKPGQRGLPPGITPRSR